MFAFAMDRVIFLTVTPLLFFFLANFFCRCCSDIAIFWSHLDELPVCYKRVLVYFQGRRLIFCIRTIDVAAAMMILKHHFQLFE